MDDMFQFARDYNKAYCDSIGATVITGKEAFDNNDAVVKRNLEDSIYNVGDVIEIPAEPAADEDPNKSQWLRSPLSKSGKPVTRPVCKVTDKAGNVTARELFYGTLTKSVKNRETKQNISVKGSITELLRNVTRQKEGWKKLAGKTLVVTKATVVPIIRRGWDGAPDRQIDTTVYDIDVK